MKSFALTAAFLALTGTVQAQEAAQPVDPTQPATTCQPMTGACQMVVYRSVS